MAETIQNPPAKANTTYVRVLLAVVVILGVLLVAGTALVIATIISRLTAPAPASSEPAAQIILSVPQGESLRGARTNNETTLIYTERSLIILDRNGKEIRRIILQEEN